MENENTCWMGNFCYKRSFHQSTEFYCLNENKDLYQIIIFSEFKGQPTRVIFNLMSGISAPSIDCSYTRIYGLIEGDHTQLLGTIRLRTLSSTFLWVLSDD